MPSISTQETTLSTQKRPLLAWVLLFILALVWGSSFILIKRSLVAFETDQVAAGRIFFAFLFFSPFLGVQARNTDIRMSVRSRWLALLGAGMFGYLIPAFLFAEAGAHLNSSLAGALNALSPLFTLLIGVVFFGRVLRIWQSLGILLGLAGSVLLIFYSATGTFSVNGYALLVVLATLCYGININIIGRFLSHMPALVSTAWIFAFVGPIAFVILVFTDFFSKLMLPTASVSLATLICLGVLGSGVMSVIFNRIVQLASPLFAASVTYLMPGVALLWGVLDGERIYPVQFMGLGICLLGIWLINKS
ncbi:DMT family transporter [Spirosoma sp. SC4-14]|uniref:DMT family transporter n=1 Tax=Spirosoma sp. SC4-14 TaxID=3128900 RepID=UPI0030D0A670